ncbi:hypothetical protein Lmor_0876 [Legionella moravica]|uniref:Uncharacterized protein n=1 Tax=Legionella moravica TaxID=39962 RepID=A0A378JTS2_9GAMM|nr:hypothetical protein [Legionella moravica]KTD35429.1 hypothetical protein Lmor_0876 [Legionella moravica]STX62014.1 Uncharacterised protein [Legionella moravica]
MLKLKEWVYCLFLFASPSLYALTTLIVTETTDSNPGGFGAVGELRYWLNTMNQNLNTMPDDYAIIFDHPMTIQLNGILPIINNSSNPVKITIGNSDPASIVTIDGNNGAYSGFFIPMGIVTIQNMIFQNLTAKGGDGGSGISGGGGGMGAGGAIYAPQTFLNGSNPAITLVNVLIRNCSAVGGNGGNYFSLMSTGNEGGGGGGGFSGNGGSITTTGSTGGAGGGGFGGNGGDVTLSTSDPSGGGGAGGGGIGSRATLGILTNLGNGGSDQSPGLDGNGYGLNVLAGSGGGGNAGGANAGGGGGGSGMPSGGGGGGSAGMNGQQPQGTIPPLRRQTVEPSGGSGGDGAGSGGGGVVTLGPITNDFDGRAGTGGYGGGGGGAAGIGAYDVGYTLQGGTGGIGGGGGGGGVNQSSTTSSEGGNSLGGGGGGGGGPSNGLTAIGGVDTGHLGGGAGGYGANSVGMGFGGGGGGGGSGLGAAVFVDSSLNFTVQAQSGTPTTFDTPSNSVQAGIHGTGGPGGSDGFDGSALGNSIFLRTGSSLTFMAQDTQDLLTIGAQVAFTDDTVFGTGGTNVLIRGKGTVVYNGTSDYQGTVKVDNANFKVNGQINQAPVFVCRNSSVSTQRGKLSGSGTLTGNVFANSGTISPDTGATLSLGSLSLNSTSGGGIGSLVHIEINSNGTSLVAVNGPATLAGTLEINLDSNAQPGQYTVLTSSGITGTFDTVTVTGNSSGFAGQTPLYTLSYLPVGAPTYVQFNFLGYPLPPSSVDIPATVNGSPILNPAVVCCGRPVILGPLPVPGAGPTTYSIINQTGNVTCHIGQTTSQTYLKMNGKNGSCTIIGTKDGIVSNPLKVIAP